MNLTKGFWIVLVIMIILFILPTILTYGAPAYDGHTDYGFPLTFYSYEGLCLGGIQCSFFSVLYLIIDLLILIVLPFMVNYLILRYKK